ncbi:hypothetical protein RSAG8_10053, partial [Rhizoctonia solani AG-8 WAC10335]
MDTGATQLRLLYPPCDWVFQIRNSTSASSPPPPPSAATWWETHHVLMPVDKQVTPLIPEADL